MKRRRSLYARPEIVRGEQCAEAPLGRWQSDRAGPGSAVGSLALAGTSSSPSRRRCRAQQVPSTGPRFGVQRAVGWSWWSGMSVRCLPCRGRPVRVLGRVHASGVRCPGERPVSAHVMSTIRCPLYGVDVRCPGVGVRAFRVRVRGVCTGDFVERVGAAAATRPGGAGSGRPAVSPNGSTICVSQRGFWSGLSGVAADA
jgi:hypothetical protein